MPEHQLILRAMLIKDLSILLFAFTICLLLSTAHSFMANNSYRVAMCTSFTSSPAACVNNFLDHLYPFTINNNVLGALILVLWNIIRDGAPVLYDVYIFIQTEHRIELVETKASTTAHETDIPHCPSCTLKNNQWNFTSPPFTTSQTPSPTITEENTQYLPTDSSELHRALHRIARFKEDLALQIRMEDEAYSEAYRRNKIDGFEQPMWSVEQLMRMITLKADMKRDWERSVVGQREYFGELIVAMNENIGDARRDVGDARR